MKDDDDDDDNDDGDDDGDGGGLFRTKGTVPIKGKIRK